MKTYKNLGVSLFWQTKVNIIEGVQKAKNEQLSEGIQQEIRLRVKSPVFASTVSGVWEPVGLQIHDKISKNE